MSPTVTIDLEDFRALSLDLEKLRERAESWKRRATVPGIRLSIYSDHDAHDVRNLLAEAGISFVIDVTNDIGGGWSEYYIHHPNEGLCEGNPCNWCGKAFYEPYDE